MMGVVLYPVLLGLVQGFSEFLPISSSGHLALVQIFLGIKGPQMGFDLILHMATLLAVVAYFAVDMLRFLRDFLWGFFSEDARSSEGWRYGWAVIAGTVVTALVGLPLKPLVETASQNSLWVGAGLVVTGIVLTVSRFIPPGARKVGLMVGLVVGLAQGIAVMPGISRSGSTIVAALAVGLSPLEAFRFSFLLSVPAVIGATLVEVFDGGGYAAFLSSLPHGWPIGFVAAGAAGFLSLVALRRVSLFRAWWMFGAYCLLLGTAVVGFSLLGV
ncbi:putative bacitracin resistance protein [Thermanaerovibrio velox DSM 12556]|uniref:Undecaprenyl-diphosphatase n=2 Tax=Thermanaerovibrio TaxID=81461 RepID=H0UNN1_9BACT|nr:putative bacitracin resistance protein [Thermanaerovibrio velox DSM 12556]